MSLILHHYYIVLYSEILEGDDWKYFSAYERNGEIWKMLWEDSSNIAKKSEGPLASGQGNHQKKKKSLATDLFHFDLDEWELLGFHQPLFNILKQYYFHNFNHLSINWFPNVLIHGDIQISWWNKHSLVCDFKFDPMET